MKNKKFESAVYEGHMLNRLKTFTDCIMSIIATIMVINIPLPSKTRGSYMSMISPLVVFFISFLVIMAFYFSTIKVFSRMHRISGWQVFVYSIFLMLISLFPLLTRIDAGGTTTFWFLIIYVIYIFVISRGHDFMMSWFLRFNDEKVEKVSFLRGTGILAGIIFLVLLFIGRADISGITLIWFPVRSLLKSLIIK